jgi:hypothetical protein
MVDGQRNSEYLIKLFSTFDADKLLKDLEKLGFIEDATQQRSYLTVEVKKEESDALAEEHLMYIKSFIIEKTQETLGLFGREFERMAEKINSTNELKAFLARWHMALREARCGRVVADRIMEDVYHIIANRPMVSSSTSAS